MRTSMIKPMGYLFLRWRTVVALLGGILAAMMMLLAVSIQQSGAQTTVVPEPHYIAAGDHHSLAVRGHDGTVYAWGNNIDGQLGNGEFNPYHGIATPVQVQSFPGNLPWEYPKNLKDVAAGKKHTLAINRINGQIYAWGDDFYGQLGNGYSLFEDPYQLYPEAVWGPCGESVAAGEYHSLALGCDGAVRAWGRNINGQLGNGTYEIAHAPVQVKGQQGSGEQFLTGVKAIAAGDNFNLALKEDGTVYAWGDNSHGQLGIGSSGGNELYPVKVHGPGNDTVNGLTDVQAIAAGHRHSLAVKSNGTVYAWGENYYGQLGVNSNNDHYYPVQVHGLHNDGVLDLGELTGTQEDLAAIAAGEHHSLALNDDGTEVYAWGGNANGQLGVDSTDKYEYPVQVHTPPPSYDDRFAFREVAAGVHHSLALRKDGSVWAWGGNAYGQLGDNTFHDRHAPVQVHAVDNVGYLWGMGPAPAAGTPPPDVAVCHKRGTPAEKTFYVPSRKAERLLSKKGYTEGACEE